MELRTIKYFTQLCEDMNFTVAAGNLYVTQQALSKAIANLESELGVQLFIRGTSGLTLTEFGQAFREEVKPALETIDRACKKIEYIKDLNHVCIHFGFALGIYTAVQNLIEDFEVQNPRIEIVGEEGSDDRCDSDLLSGKQDIILLNEPIDPQGCIPVYECPLVMIVAEGGVLDRELTPEEIADGLLIDYGPEFNLAKRIRAAFERRGLELTMQTATSDKTAHYSGVRKGKSVILMSEHEAVEFVASHPGTTYRPFPLENEESSWRLCIKYNEKAVASEELQIFINYLKANIETYIIDSFRDIYSL